MDLRRTVTLLASALLVAVPTATRASTTPPADSDNAHVFTIGDVTVPAGEPDTLSVVLSGPGVQDSVPLIVRNNTNEAAVIVVTGNARDPAGELVATGQSHGFFPSLVQPGQWAMGYVSFESYILAGDEQFEFTVINQGAEWAWTDWTVTEATVQDDPRRVVGIVQNNAEETVKNGRVAVACFEGPLLNGVHHDFVPNTDVGPGESIGFTVRIRDSLPCSAIAIAGWS